MAKSRGRPRTFDEAKVRSQIMQTFWEHGFEGTSLDDLSVATGLVRPSLYGAFGSKTDMYLASLDTYIKLLHETIGQRYRHVGSVSGALSAFYRAALELYCRNTGSGQLGCMVSGTAANEAPSNEIIRENLKDKLTRLDKMMRSVVVGSAPAHADAQTIDTASVMASAVLHSISIRARSGADRSSLDRMASSAATLIGEQFSS